MAFDMSERVKTERPEDCQEGVSNSRNRWYIRDFLLVRFMCRLRRVVAQPPWMVLSYVAKLGMSRIVKDNRGLNKLNLELHSWWII